MTTTSTPDRTRADLEAIRRDLAIEAGFYRNGNRPDAADHFQQMSVGLESAIRAHDAMRARIAALEAERDTLRSTLKAVEWEGQGFLETATCPSCGNFHPGDHERSPRGHRADCTLAAALAAQPEEPTR